MRYPHTTPGLVLAMCGLAVVFACAAEPAPGSENVLARSVSTAAAAMEVLLECGPISSDAYSTEYDGYQLVDDIPRNLERLYGVGCVLEVPYRGPLRAETFPSKEADYVPLKVSADTSLSEFLDAACSDGQLEWDLVEGAIHLWPTWWPNEAVTYLDAVKISLDVEGASLLEAAKAWALEVNRSRPTGGHGVRVNHAFRVPLKLQYRSTPPSLTRSGAVTLRLDDVTAREALCAIQSISREWVRIMYYAHQGSPQSLNIWVTQEEADSVPEVSAEERQRLNEQEDLDAVLVEPLAARQESQGAG